METIVSNSTLLFGSPYHPPTTRLSHDKLFFSPSANLRSSPFASGFRKYSSYFTSSVGSLVIKCGVSSGGSSSVKEINESQFSDTVLKSDRPVLVEFVANWCGPCRLISPAIQSIAQEYSDRLLVIKIDHDANPRLIEEYKVYGLPTLILFKNGQEVPESRREGAITKVKLKEYVDGLLESISVV